MVTWKWWTFTLSFVCSHGQICWLWGFSLTLCHYARDSLWQLRVQDSATESWTLLTMLWVYHMGWCLETWRDMKLTHRNHALAQASAWPFVQTQAKEHRRVKFFSSCILVVQYCWIEHVIFLFFRRHADMHTQINLISPYWKLLIG